MTTVGEYLKNARKARNLSVRDVAARTKITPKYIRCIEDDDYDHLPKGPYIKGYISAYALQVCGENDKALQLYASCNPPAPSPTMPAAARMDAADSADKVHPLYAWWQSLRRSGVSGGLSLLRRLAHAWPARARRREAGGTGAFSSHGRSTRRHPLASLGQRAADRMASRRQAVLKRTLHVVGFGAGSAVLVLAAIGVYHVLFHGRNPTDATAGRQMKPTAAARPPTVEGTTSPLASGAAERKTATRNKSPAKAPAAAGGNPAQAPRPPSSASVSPASAQANGAAPFTAADHPSEGDAAPKVPGGHAAITLIEARVCTAVADRMPVGAGDTFPWTTPRIYVWSLVGAADPPARVHHIYYHGKDKIADVVLKVGSSHWRTWSFQSLGKKRLQGAWRVDIASDDGQVLRSLHFEVR